MPDRRRSERKSCNKRFHLTVTVLELNDLKKLNIDATAFDISDEGFGLKVNYPLECGQIIRFHHNAEQHAGIVKWETSAGSSYKIGVQFI